MDSLKKKNLSDLKKYVDKALVSFLNKEKNEKINEIVLHSLSGGKRIRPIICYLVFKHFIDSNPYQENDFKNIILIPEIIHNLSLIIDDLPCMDNDDYRRDKLTTHKKYGIVPSYIVISKIISNLLHSFKDLVDFKKYIFFKTLNGVVEKKHYRDFFTHEIFESMESLIEGQYYDLSFLNLNMDIEILYKINSKKTSPLFSLSFILGYTQIPLFKPDFIIEERIVYSLKEVGELFGLIFQLNDDIIDRESDSKQEKNLNISLCLGYQKSLDIFYEKCELFKEKLIEIGIWNDNFKEIIILLKKRISKDK